MYASLVKYSVSASLPTINNKGRGDTVSIWQNASQAASLSLLDKTSKKAERYLRQIKAARYMKDRLGDEYYGLISSISNKGIFVEVEGLEIEGFIESTYVGSNYRFYPDMQSVYIDKIKAYELGDKVKVLVASANVENGKIFFSL